MSLALCGHGIITGQIGKQNNGFRFFVHLHRSIDFFRKFWALALTGQKAGSQSYDQCKYSYSQVVLITNVHSTYIEN
jgi:hypothetical protein